MSNIAIAIPIPSVAVYRNRLNWDFPALETLNMSYIRLGDCGDKSQDLFSKCVNLRELTLHKVCIFGLNVFNVCAPQLFNLSITDPYAYPNVVNVVASKLKNPTVSVNVR